MIVLDNIVQDLISDFFFQKHLSKDDLEHQRLNFLSEKMDNLTIFYKALQNILIPRVVGSENHTLVQNVS